MTPIFLFIGIGIFLSLDIMQPSMFQNIMYFWPLFIGAMLVGSAPVYLISGALNNILTKFYVEKNKKTLNFGVLLVVIFMFSEIVYSYISVQGFFVNQQVPISKIIGIMFLPFTFSLYYFSNFFYEKHNIHRAEHNHDELLKEREKVIEEIKRLGNELP